MWLWSVQKPRIFQKQGLAKISAILCHASLKFGPERWFIGYSWIALVSLQGCLICLQVGTRICVLFKHFQHNKLHFELGTQKKNHVLYAKSNGREQGKHFFRSLPSGFPSGKDHLRVSAYADHWHQDPGSEKLSPWQLSWPSAFGFLGARDEVKLQR